MSVVFATVALAPVDENDVAPGLLGFVVVVALGVALFFLLRSMNKQISKIQAPKEEELRQADWDRKQAERDSGNAAGDSGADRSS